VVLEHLPPFALTLLSRIFAETSGSDEHIQVLQAG
jgi:hypothetical protein